VHHDLQTVTDYFDWVALLNIELIAAGDVRSTFTNENLRRTYGATATLIDEEAARVALPLAGD
jgi:manganese/zinc/iron transport system ATP- binding protein